MGQSYGSGGSEHLLVPTSRRLHEEINDIDDGYEKEFQTRMRAVYAVRNAIVTLATQYDGPGVTRPFRHRLRLDRLAGVKIGRC